MKNILIFEPDESGHHSGYLFHLISNFLINDYSYKLIVVVNPDFLKKHPQVIGKTLSERVEWVSFSDSEFQEWKKPKSVFKRANEEWSMFCQYANTYKAVYGFFMYIDYLQLAILTQSPSPCPVSGILFRPTLVNYGSVLWREKVNFWRKNLLLRFFVKNKKIDSLFSLDPYATKYISEKWSIDKVEFLPDPFKKNPTITSVTDFKKSIGIEDNRKIFLLFGFLDSRKGISDIMDAIANISRELSMQGCLLVVGKWEGNEKELFDEKMKSISQNSNFQIITNNYFISEEEIQQYFEVSDYILALYQKHIGMSGIMVRSAAAEKPLLVNDFGLMGKIVLENELGIVVNGDLQEKFEMLLSEDVNIGNPIKMKAFADLNRAENFAKVILDKFEKVYNDSPES
jgi:glycosyltransferase involved in cell wall biosynthesis